MTSSYRFKAHQHALRAARAVTGCAHRVHHASLVCVLATSLACSSQSTRPSPDVSTDGVSPETSAPDASTPVANDVTAGEEPASCVGDDGLTDWRCCVENRLDAAGCDICEVRFPSVEQAQGCLTCGAFDEDDLQCCQAVTSLMTELDMIDVNDMSDPLGCAPWGPPAPPAYTRHRPSLYHAGVLRSCPTHHRRERRRGHAFT